MIFVYCRVSTRGQAEDGDSLTIQVNKCTAWAKYKHPDTEIRVIEEPAVSGSKPLKERPAGAQLFKEIKKGDIFVSMKLDRAFRNTQDALSVAEDFKNMGVGLVLLNISENDITTDAAGKMVFTMLSAVAEMERDTITARMSEGKAYRRDQGGFVGGRPGFGWKSIADPNHAKGKIRVRNEEEQLVIKKLMAWRKSGRSFTSFGHHAWEWFGIEKNTSTWIRIHARETQNS